MVKPSDVQEIIKALDKLISREPDYLLCFYTGGTGIPDETAIDFWKDSNVVVVARDGTRYQYGKKMEE